MKKLVILSLMLVSVSAFSQSSKAVQAVIPESAQINKAKKAADAKTAAKGAEAPCADSKEDVLKKLEEKKQAQAKANKGFSLQGNTDTGCTIK
ncbi:hypothetical protein SHI21_04870 [Bacteriovorax sp. PP10]|uniref:Uncharacterized protein n=1 Tax=Bacteriovorax antarcticus TaxID=3088717 RepID=A0ABU5VR88_9BACT|nr:hypothetical protein [Bacteriovorax sp. PP10]MEA9355516.1 hypothetical protein [Bacteriovorax sp. PP10]